MKKSLKIFIIVFISGISLESYSQLFYKNELPSEDGVEINYRFAKEKFLKKDSPQTIRFKLKNTNDYDVNVKLELIYHLNIIDRYESGLVEICIPSNRSRKGRHGLMFEVLVDNPEDFENDENFWELETFEVEEVPECE